MNRLLLVGLASLLTSFAPTALAHARGHVDVDLDVEADLEVVATARTRHDARLSYEWAWGDGEASAGAEARHAYARPGRYEVLLKVTDEETGRCWTERKVVRVEGAARSAAEADAEADADAEAEAKAERSRGRGESSASATVSTSGLGARASLALGEGREAAQDDGWDDEGRAHARGRVRSQSDGHNEVPGAGVALLVPALAGLALALRRR